MIASCQLCLAPYSAPKYSSYGRSSANIFDLSFCEQIKIYSRSKLVEERFYFKIKYPSDYVSYIYFLAVLCNVYCIINPWQT